MKSTFSTHISNQVEKYKKLKEILFNIKKDDILKTTEKYIVDSKDDIDDNFTDNGLCINMENLSKETCNGNNINYLHFCSTDLVNKRPIYDQWNSEVTIMNSNNKYVHYLSMCSSIYTILVLKHFSKSKYESKITFKLVYKGGMSMYYHINNIKDSLLPKVSSTINLLNTNISNINKVSDDDFNVYISYNKEITVDIRIELSTVIIQALSDILDTINLAYETNDFKQYNEDSIIKDIVSLDKLGIDNYDTLKNEMKKIVSIIIAAEYDKSQSLLTVPTSVVNGKTIKTLKLNSNSKSFEILPNQILDKARYNKDILVKTNNNCTEPNDYISYIQKPKTNTGPFIFSFNHSLLVKYIKNKITGAYYNTSRFDLFRIKKVYKCNTNDNQNINVKSEIIDLSIVYNSTPKIEDIQAVHLNGNMLTNISIYSLDYTIKDIERTLFENIYFGIDLKHNKRVDRLLLLYTFQILKTDYVYILLTAKSKNLKDLKKDIIRRFTKNANKLYLLLFVTMGLLNNETNSFKKPNGNFRTNIETNFDNILTNYSNEDKEYLKLIYNSIILDPFITNNIINFNLPTIQPNINKIKESMIYALHNTLKYYDIIIDIVNQQHSNLNLDYKIDLSLKNF